MIHFFLFSHYSGHPISNMPNLSSQPEIDFDQTCNQETSDVDNQGTSDLNNQETSDLNKQEVTVSSPLSTDMPIYTGTFCESVHFKACIL